MMINHWIEGCKTRSSDKPLQSSGMSIEIARNGRIPKTSEDVEAVRCTHTRCPFLRIESSLPGKETAD